MGDELDEIDNSGALINKTRTIIIDLQNLDEPIRHFDYVSDTDAIDHNGYVKGSKFNKKGIANIGFRPTFNGKNLLLETNIFGINKNLYNKEINVSFKKFIRPEKKFKDLEHLKKQIKIDIKKAK